MFFTTVVLNQVVFFNQFATPLRVSSCYVPIQVSLRNVRVTRILFLPRDAMHNSDYVVYFYLLLFSCVLTTHNKLLL